MDTCDVFQGGRRLQRSLLGATEAPAAVAEELAAQVEELTERVAALEGRLQAEPAAASGWVALVTSPGGYLIHELDGPPPREGDVVEVAGGEVAVTRLGPSPFPGDERRCAFAEPCGGPPLASAAWPRSTS